VMVTAPGNEIRIADIPQDFGGSAGSAARSNVWTTALAEWARQHLAIETDKPLLPAAQAEFERILIKAALQVAHGRKQDAAKLLGWGRNTLTRKLKELDIEP
jgi:two-component system, NtrC family, nitrogen regulation response regulator GlnG